jgi:[pyruvate, water dikinase]-phosphate phosphotransferase / [pyruvate, water dikinase] kinase
MLQRHYDQSLHQPRMQRTVFYVSESTGITAETVGHSLLSQFEGIDFTTVYMPFINTRDKALELVARLKVIKQQDGNRPIIFGTLLDSEIRALFSPDCCLYMELFDTFVGPLSEELGVPPTRKSGQSHSLKNPGHYDSRIDAINFTMANDDGMRIDDFPAADVILVGVSRSGKTPTCLYLALHFGLKAANYPLTDEDFERAAAPGVLMPHRHKLFGLTIEAERLHRIRQERRPNSSYASLPRCREELRRARDIFAQLGVAVIDTTTQSIEEISSQIVKGL